ncbi:DUF3310 domain-containing protein [Streptomyces sp. NPDC001356]
MSYEIGQVVVVSNPSTLYSSQFRGQRAVVTDIKRNEIFPYELTFGDGQTLGFAAEEFTAFEDQDHDEVNHPSHYTWIPGGLEVIDITEHMNFNLGNAVKYVLRSNHKHDQPLTDLRKAAWYINREIERLEAAQ